MANKFTVSPLGIITDDIGGAGYSGATSSYTSLFSSYSSDGVRRRFYKTTGFVNGSVLSDKRHSEEIYDIRTNNIIKKLNTPNIKSTNLDVSHLSLRSADFAYLKDLGVYPNNRLMVCRRFPVPVVDDLYSVTKSPGTPLSTVLGFVPEGDDFLKFSFNEEWEAADVSFKTLLNELGKDFGFNLGGGAGDILEGAVNVIPLPGASLLLQRKIMASMGLFGDLLTDTNGKFVENDKGEFLQKDAPHNPIPGVPQGDPNLIKEAMNRTLIGENSPGSGLKCKFDITLKTVYEQKFIQGVDPTLVFMDILNNVLNLGTSNASFYLGKQTDASGNTTKYIQDFMNDPIKKIGEFIKTLIDALSDQLTQLDKKMRESKDEKKPATSGNMASEAGELLKNNIVVAGTINYVKDFIKMKYKIKFIGIINALTGGPSTPWHVTIGNPLRPIFCSGDMLCKSVSMNLGPQLSFNDLPTFIEVEIKLESARNLGLQEIFAKFNCGGIRVTEGDFNGQYLGGDSDSYWNSENYALVGKNAINSIGPATSNIPTTSQAAFSMLLGGAGSALNQNLQDPTQSVSTVMTPTGQITPSVDNHLETNCDPHASDRVVAAGSMQGSTELRLNNTQQMTGSTWGSTSQVIEPDASVNSGVDAKVIDDKPYDPDKDKNIWSPGEVEGKYPISDSNNKTIIYTIRKSTQTGYYETSFDYGGRNVSYSAMSPSSLRDVVWDSSKTNFN